MASSIQGPMPPAGGGMRGPGAGQSLTKEQVALVQSILGDYDASSLTENDISAINRSFKDAGIPPSRALRTTIESAGFDPEQLRGQGGPDAMGIPPAQGGGGINVQSLQSLQEILERYNLSSLSSEEEGNLMTELVSSGLFRAGLMLDVTT